MRHPSKGHPEFEDFFGWYWFSKLWVQLIYECSFNIHECLRYLVSDVAFCKVIPSSYNMVIFVKLVLLNIPNKSSIFSGSPNAELVSQIYTYYRNAKILIRRFWSKRTVLRVFQFKNTLWHCGEHINLLMFQKKKKGKCCNPWTNWCTGSCAFRLQRLHLFYAHWVW